MKIFGKSIIPLFLVAVMLTSCNGFISTPVVSPTDLREIAIPTTVAETQTSIPTAAFTATPLPSPSPLPPTETSMPISEGIVYYYFVMIAENVPPERSVVIMPNEIALAPTQSNIASQSPDIVTSLKAALEAVLNDERNYWISSDLKVTNITFNDGRADVVLDGEYFGVAHIILTAARMQILLTLFANTSVQTATVTLNGDTIANIAISNSRDAKPTDYVYTRAEIETFMAENAYVMP